MYLIPQGIGTPSDIVSFLLLGLRNYVSHAPTLLQPFEYDVTDTQRSVDITASDTSVEFADSITEVEL